MPKSRERWEGGAIGVGKMDEMIKALTPPERGLENAKMSAQNHTYLKGKEDEYLYTVEPRNNG